MLPSLSSSFSAPQEGSSSYFTDTHWVLTTHIVAKGNKSKRGIPLWRIKKKMVDVRYFHHLTTEIITGALVWNVGGIYEMESPL